jgi:hypothetical protein
MERDNGSSVDLSTLRVTKATRRYLVWKYGPKPTGKKAKKLPFYVSGKPRQKPLDCESDWQQLVSYEEAVAFCRANPEYRVGFALGPDGGGNCWQGLDFDGTLQGSDSMPGYVERSPSGTGYHAIGYGRHFHAYTDKFEAYSSGRFFTFTGDLINDGPLHDFAEFVNSHHGKLGEHIANIHQEVRSYSVEQLLDAMAHIPNDDLDWNTWNNLGMALYGAVGGHVIGLAAWIGFSAKSEKFDARDSLDRWEHFKKSTPDEVGAGTIIHWARNAGWKATRASAGENDPLVNDALDYMPGAQSLAPMEFVIENFVRTGLYAFYGPYNAGKTSGIVALCLFVAGVLEVAGLPTSLRRKVFYIAEDPEQILNIIEGYFAKGMLKGDDFKDWYYIIPSKRRPSEYWSKKIQSVVDDSGRTWGGPLVVFDTASSNMDIEDISNNSKVGQFIAALKESSRSELLTISVWIVLHVAKSLREEVAEDLTALGAQAWGADTFGEVKFTIESGKYCVTLGKRRFEIERDSRGIAIDRYVVASETLTAAVAEAPWSAECPGIVRKTRTLRVVREFEPSSLEDAKEERVKDIKEAMKSKVSSEANSRLLRLLRAAKDLELPGVCVWAIEGKKQSPPKDSLKGYVWHGLAEFSARSSPKKDELDFVRQCLIWHSSVERVGDLLFFPIKILEGNIARFSV